MNPPQVQDALAALERLLQRNVLTHDEGRKAARVLTGDAAFEFPASAQAGTGPGPATE